MNPKDKLRQREWMVYILRCSDGSFYTGATKSLEKRLLKHNRGTASKYTRSRRPVALWAKSVPMSKSDALRLELRIKKMPKEKKIAAVRDGLGPVHPATKCLRTEKH